MISKLFSFFFPLRKTMLQLAKERLLENNMVLNVDGPLNVDVYNDKILTVGKLIPRKIGIEMKFLIVLFNHEGNTVAIKDGEEVIFYFNTENDVKEIQETLASMCKIKEVAYA